MKHNSILYITFCKGYLDVLKFALVDAVKSIILFCYIHVDAVKSIIKTLLLCLCSL